MKKAIYTLLFLFGLGAIQAQEEVYIPCGYDIYVNDLSKEYPEFQERLDFTFARSKDVVKMRSDDIYTIDVVVHIVYQDSSQNIPDSRVYAVMDKVTKDFMRQNDDADSVRDIFKDRVASANIQFNVHAIERIKTDATFDFDLFAGLPDHVKRTDGGGSDAYNPEKFMNLWVCNLEGGLLGYAYPPAGLYNWPDGSNAPEVGLDGVVVATQAFNVFDTITIESSLGGGSTTIPIRGRTVTHEIGHYLGLRHIWGDGLAVLGIPACNEDDGIEDTPNQGLPSQFACNTLQNTCIDGEDDEPDMIENFMDYASEPCENSFTRGQAAHMRSVLENERIGLIDSTTSVINPHKQHLSINLYPNPARDYLNLHIRQTIKENVTVDIYDFSGKHVQTEIFESSTGNQRIDISQLTKGIYFLRASTQDNIYSNKFIVF